MSTIASIPRLGANADLDTIHRAYERYNVVVIEELLSSTIVLGVNEEAEDTLAAARSDAGLFNPITRSIGTYFERSIGSLAPRPKG